jgi:hypothetical protein
MSWGIGFVWEGRWLAWHFLPGWKEEGRDIGWAEMVAIELALHAVVAARHRSVHLIIRSDNEGVVGATHAGKSHNSPSNLILRWIVDLFHDHDLWATITWISTKDNLADRPSCGLFPAAHDIFPYALKLPSHLSPFLEPCISAQDLSYLHPIVPKHR